MLSCNIVNYLIKRQSERHIIIGTMVLLPSWESCLPSDTKHYKTNNNNNNNNNNDNNSSGQRALVLTG